LFDRNSFWRKRHTERLEIEPVGWPRQTVFTEKSIVKRSSRIRRQQSEDREAGRPGIEDIGSSSRDARGIAVHSENKRRNGIQSPVRQLLKNLRVFARFIEPLVHLFQTVTINGFQSDKYPAAATGTDQIEQFGIAQQVDT